MLGEKDGKKATQTAKKNKVSTKSAPLCTCGNVFTGIYYGHIDGNEIF